MNIDKLKQVIQKANPEIMELKFGCRIIEKRTTLGWKGIIMSETGQSKAYSKAYSKNFSKDTDEYYIYYPESVGISSWLKTDEIKSLGRPIRLADVLIVIEKLDKALHFCHLAKELCARGGLLELWNLKDNNLDSQSDETKQFLIDILVKSARENKTSKRDN